MMCACRAVRTLRAASQGREDAADLAAGLAVRPQTGAAWASLYEIELQEMKRVLAAQSVTLHSSRFEGDADAELMRFAIAGGILQVRPASHRPAWSGV